MAYMSGNWVVKAGSEAEFVDRWSSFASWTDADVEGLHWAILLKDGDDGRHYISLSEWESPEHAAAWRANPKFAELLGACRELCDDFSSSGYSLAASVGKK